METVIEIGDLVHTSYSIMSYDIAKARRQWSGFSTAFNTVVTDLEHAIATHNEALNVDSKALVQAKYDKLQSTAEKVKSFLLEALSEDIEQEDKWEERLNITYGINAKAECAAVNALGLELKQAPPLNIKMEEARSTAEILQTLAVRVDETTKPALLTQSATPVEFAN